MTTAAAGGGGGGCLLCCLLSRGGDSRVYFSQSVKPPGQQLFLPAPGSNQQFVFFAACSSFKINAEDLARLFHFGAAFRPLKCLHKFCFCFFFALSSHVGQRQGSGTCVSWWCQVAEALRIRAVQQCTTVLPFGLLPISYIAEEMN